MASIWILYAVTLGLFILSTVATVAKIILFSSMYEVFWGIIATLLTGWIWVRTEEIYAYPILGRIYKRLPDTGKIYALYLYDNIEFITLGLSLLVIAVAIAYTFLVENGNPDIHDVIITVAAFVICVLVEVPIVQYIFKRKVFEDYICLVLAVSTGIGLLMIYGGITTLQIGLLICGAILFFFSAYGFFRYLNNMIKIVSPKKMEKVDKQISKVVEKGIDAALGMAGETDDSELPDNLLKTKIIGRLVFDTVTIIAEVLFYIFFVAFSATAFMVISATVVCIPSIIIVGRKIWINAKALRDWNNMDEG